MPLSRG